jgi:hypothetical protein
MKKFKFLGEYKGIEALMLIFSIFIALNVLMVFDIIFTKYVFFFEIVFNFLKWHIVLGILFWVFL